MRKLKEKLFLKEYDEEKIKIANKTARASGASALNKDGSIRSVVGRYVLDNVSKDASILDFGSGPAAVQTLALRDAGFKNVSAYDFGVNTRDGIQDPDALNKKYDVVFASNVLNVSSDEEMLRETLRDIKKAAKNEIVFNYPSSPRKSGLNAQEVKDIIIDEYGVEPELVSGTKSAPVWKVLLNNSKNISEDTVKTRDGKWTNRGDSGETHGEFRTKKQADAQRKAIYASGWKKESVEDLANRVRKNDLEWDDEIEASYAEDGDVAVQFQDRETLTHEVTPYRSRRPRVSSNTWGRIWKDGNLVYNERGPKYKVRDDIIKKLNSMNESFESDLERKLVRMWFNEDQAAWLVKHDPETAEWLAYGNIRTQDLIDVEREINQKMAVKKIKESSKSLREFKDTKIGATSVNNSLEEDWSKGLSFTFKITTNSLQNAFKNGSVRVGGQNKADLSSMYGDTSLRFKIVGKPYSSANDGYINVDRNESELHVNLYDKDFTYKDIGGKSNFNKAKLTQEMEELKNSIENDLKDAGLVITQSKVEVGGSPKFNTTWRQAQKYNEDLDLSNDKDFYTYSNFNSDLYNAMSDVVYDYSSKGISKKDIEKAVEWFLTHFFDDYDEGKLEENKHIQKAKSYTSAKSKSPLSESRWDDYDDVWSTPESAAKSLFDRGLVASDYVERACKRHGKDQDFAYEVGVIISQLIEEDEHLGESKSIAMRESVESTINDYKKLRDIDIDTTLLCNRSIRVGNYRARVDTIYIQFQSGFDKYPKLVGYAHLDNGGYDHEYLSADDIHNYDLSRYMNGTDITDLDGMLRDNPSILFDADELNESKYIKEGIDDTLNKLGGPVAFRRELMAAVDAYPGIEDDVRELAGMLYGRYEDVISIEELESAIEYMIDDALESYPVNESKSINEDMSEEDYDEFFSIVDKIGPAINAAGGDMDDINGNLSHPYEDEDRIKIVFVSTVDKKDTKKFVKTVEAEIEKALQTTRFNRVRDIYVYQLSGSDLQMRVPASLRSEFSKKFSMFEIDIRASADL